MGCKLNFAETSYIADVLAKEGYARVGFDELADVYVINTCSVTENANRKCRQTIKKAQRINASAYIVVMGCYAQLKPKEIAEIPGVDLVLGAGEKFNIARFVNELEKKQNNGAEVHTGEIKDVKAFMPSYSSGDRTRTFLKVQDGCDYFCAFCTIPLARGFSRSGTIENICNQASEIASKGIEEIVLTGVNIGDFKNEKNESFLELIQALDQIKGIKRYRISSIEPNLLSDEIIEFVNNSQKFVPHFHIPLQSGSDVLLKNMRRRYDTTLYKSRIEKIKSLMPHACIGVDVIVGFPGETKEEFEKTQDFLQNLDVSYLHVFSYSERPNTTAIRMDKKVSPKDIKYRSKQLQLLSLKKKEAFYQSQIGKTHRVLWEKEESDGKMHGFTDNYLKLQAPYEPNKARQLDEVYVNEVVHLGSDVVAAS